MPGVASVHGLRGIVQQLVLRDEGAEVWLAKYRVEGPCNDQITDIDSQASTEHGIIYRNSLLPLLS